MRNLIIPLTLSAFLVFSSASAQDYSQQSFQAAMPTREGHAHRSGAMGPLPRGLFELSLTSTQALAVRQLIEENKTEWQGLQGEIRVASQALDDASNAKNYDETTVRDSAKNLAAIQEGLIVLKAKITQAVRALLSEDQLTSLDAIRASRLLNMTSKDESSEATE